MRPWGRAATPPLLAETHPASPQTSQLTLLVLQGIGLMESRWGDFKHAVSSCFLFFPPTLAASFMSVYSRDAHGHTPQCTASKAQDDTHGHTQTPLSAQPSKAQGNTHKHTPQCTAFKSQRRHTQTHTSVYIHKSPEEHTQTHTSAQTLKSPEQHIPQCTALKAQNKRLLNQELPLCRHRV